VIGQFQCGFAIGFRHHLEAIGEDGSLFLADPWHGVSAGLELRREDGTERIEIAEANPYTHELIDFARAVRGDAPPLLGADDALAQARIVEALYASAATSTTKGLT
jgi:predicted dehydrogenase